MNLMDSFQTEQEEFWAGQFGDEYSARNVGEHLLAAKVHLFSKAIARTSSVSSIIEFGANRGLNLVALKILKPNAQLSAIEINKTAVAALRERGGVTVYHQSILDWQCDDAPRDLVLISGVLIHMDPESLPLVYRALHSSSKRYILLVEYYNPSPVAIEYRGHTDKLFKRDFAGEILDMFADLRLVDYGFTYRRDPNFPQDDNTWFLLEKVAN